MNATKLKKESFRLCESQTIQIARRNWKKLVNRDNPPPERDNPASERDQIPPEHDKPTPEHDNPSVSSGNG